MEPREGVMDLVVLRRNAERRTQRVLCSLEELDRPIPLLSHCGHSTRLEICSAFGAAPRILRYV
eukprot:CAMPEP_0174707334 /NCGR_PEP_ID=MMETSP1094-20130205/9875_1 /TAXON_ID=156173 /ORGANISM="Chrysochromulina brevifilum, Strain UTEX LB 985" /LENGTH=63 /DNA_ID=CAMNT_0015905695 /DNA_START=561 /DNA_END=749 /DNA_ORIENTATION=-